MEKTAGGRSFFYAFRSGFAQVLDQGEDAEHYQDDQADEQQDIEQLGKDGGIHSRRSFPGRGRSLLPPEVFGHGVTGGDGQHKAAGQQRGIQKLGNGFIPQGGPLLFHLFSSV